MEHGACLIIYRSLEGRKRRERIQDTNSGEKHKICRKMLRRERGGVGCKKAVLERKVTC